MPKYARVMVDDSGGNAFDYELPAEVAEPIQVGSRVRVPVRTRTMLGTIIELSDTTEAQGVKPIQRVVSAEPILSPLLIRLGEWMAEYYCCPLETALRTSCRMSFARPRWGTSGNSLPRRPARSRTRNWRRWQEGAAAGRRDRVSARGSGTGRCGRTAPKCDAAMPSFRRW